MQLGVAISMCCDNAFNRGLEQGRMDAMILGESEYGAVHSSICLFEFTSFKELRREIRSRRRRRYGDNPGQAYMWTCKCVHIHRNDYNRVAVLVCAVHYDV